MLIVFNCIFKGSYVNDFNHNRDDFNIKCARLLGGFYFLIPLTRLGSLKLYIDIEDNYSTLANKILFRYNIWYRPDHLWLIRILFILPPAMSQVRALLYKQSF